MSLGGRYNKYCYLSMRPIIVFHNSTRDDITHFRNANRHPFGDTDIFFVGHETPENERISRISAFVDDDNRSSIDVEMRLRDDELPIIAIISSPLLLLLLVGDDRSVVVLFAPLTTLLVSVVTRLRCFL